MDRFWKEAVGLGALCLLFGVVANKGAGDDRMAVALASIGAVLVLAGLLSWWVRGWARVIRGKREDNLGDTGTDQTRT